MLVIAILFFVTAWLVSKRRQAPWWLNEVLNFIGGACLAGSALGQTITGVATNLGGAISGAASSISGAGFGANEVVGLVAFFMLLIIALDIAWDRNSNKWANICLALFCSVAAGVGGNVGDIAGIMAELGQDTGTWAKTQLIG